jgi:hypothetical protein
MDTSAHSRIIPGLRVDEPPTDLDETELVALGQPPVLPARRGSDLGIGLGILPEHRLRVFSPDQLEIVIEYWLREAVERKYEHVVRWGGPGDKGRDVVAYPNRAEKAVWDNYQAKRYATQLTPSDIWQEICKLVHWVTQGAYPAPRRYVFVAPLGCGSKARELLETSGEELRSQLLAKWDQHGSRFCPLDDIKDAIKAFDFPEFDAAEAGELVADLKGTASYSVLFGGGLAKPRPPDETPPAEITTSELGYVAALVEAYDEHCPGGVADAQRALEDGTYGPHLRRSRREFYCAESLREFSKDVLTEPDNFESLQQQIEDGIQNTLAKSFPDGYARVLAVCEHATTIQISDHPLRAELRPADRSGVCHQLANDGRVRWKQP